MTEPATYTNVRTDCHRLLHDLDIALSDIDQHSDVCDELSDMLDDLTLLNVAIITGAVAIVELDRCATTGCTDPTCAVCA